MKKRLRLKPYVFPIVYMILVLVLLGTVYYNGLINYSYSNNTDNNMQYVVLMDLLDSIEVSKNEDVMVRPYNSDGVTIGKSFYDYRDESDKQVNSIIYYEGTYIQNSGVDYVSSETFDIVSCLDGTIVSVEETDLMGYVVEIKYNNDIIISYQSMSEVTVKVNDTVSKGEVIGKSGKSSIASELGNHLHLEMYYDGVAVNPEDYYNTNIKEI